MLLSSEIAVTQEGLNWSFSGSVWNRIDCSESGAKPAMKSVSGGKRWNKHAKLRQLVVLAALAVVSGVEGLPKVFRNNEICGMYNGHRVYLELGDRGQLQATNVTFSKVSSYLNKIVMIQIKRGTHIEKHLFIVLWTNWIFLTCWSPGGVVIVNESWGGKWNATNRMKSGHSFNGCCCSVAFCWRLSICPKACWIYSYVLLCRYLRTIFCLRKGKKKVVVVCSVRKV